MSPRKSSTFLFPLLSLLRLRGGAVELKSAAKKLNIPKKFLDQLIFEINCSGIPPYQPYDMFSVESDEKHARLESEPFIPIVPSLSASQHIHLEDLLSDFYRRVPENEYQEEHLLHHETFTSYRSGYYPELSHIVDIVLQAIDKNDVLSITYLSPDTKRIETESVFPRQLLFTNGEHILVCQRVSVIDDKIELPVINIQHAVCEQKEIG